MKDIFGNTKPVQIETEEWWFNGRIIQKNDHPMLSRYVSWSDDENSRFVETHNTKREATLFYTIRLILYHKQLKCTTATGKTS